MKSQGRAPRCTKMVNRAIWSPTPECEGKDLIISGIKSEMFIIIDTNKRNQLHPCWQKSVLA
ncbi:unnamed protein product [Coregonus sp. 'balchen']|nr:unnamed protein product [Coregonus sp. 'balchen']